MAVSIKRNVLPEIIVATASAIWGLLWIPLRAFDRQGLAPGWVIVCQFVAPLVLMTPLAVLRWRRGGAPGTGQFATGLLIGGAVVLYCESLLQTDVVRSLILFYMMPAWGTLLEVGLLGRRFTLWRGLALLLSFGGLLVILGAGGSFSVHLNLGDLMALVSGIVYTFGALRVRQAPQIAVFEQVFAFFLFGSLVALGISMLPLAALRQPPEPKLLLPLAPWILLLTVVLIPAMWGQYWGSRYVDPGRLGILLQLEAVVGIGSAALFAGERFGVREFLGTALIISAGLMEVFVNKANQGE